MTETMRFTAQHDETGSPDIEALAAFTENRLSASERAAIAAHLSTCEICRTIVAELTRADVRSSAVVSRVRWLPIAAMLAIAAVGGGLYITTLRPAGVPLTAPAPTPGGARPTDVAPPANPAPPVATPGGDRAPKTTTSDRDRLRDAGTRTIAEKTFRLAAGEWIDTEYRLSNFLPEVDIRSRADFDAHPALRTYAVLGSRFTVVLSGTVYRVSLSTTTP